MPGASRESRCHGRYAERRGTTPAPLIFKTEGAVTITSIPKEIPESWQSYLRTVRDRPTVNEMRSKELRSGCYNSRDMARRTPRPVIRVG